VTRVAGPMRIGATWGHRLGLWVPEDWAVACRGGDCDGAPAFTATWWEKLRATRRHRPGDVRQRQRADYLCGEHGRAFAAAYGLGLPGEARQEALL